MVILSVVKWYFVLLGIGVISFPICFRFMNGLPGRGFAFARIFGLILISYSFWLLCSLGVLTNNIGSLTLMVIVCVIVSLCFFLQQHTQIRDWLKRNFRYCLIAETVFLLAFIFILLFRLSSPDISGTEKPMEMTFINGILRSDTFPPHDSWLSGYAISYYYFGYIMTAILIMLTGVLSTAGFNLMLATVFALAAVAALGLLNDMFEIKRSRKTESVKMHKGAFLAPFFALIAGNLEGFLEMLHSRGIFWQADGTSSFWKWLDLKELSDVPTRISTWDPTGRSGIWWWRASRVISDHSLDGGAKEIIDEFPFFSFQLGDLHPHVIDIPFVIFAIAIIFNMFITQLNNTTRAPHFAKTLLDDNLSLRDGWMAHWVTSLDFWITSLCVGALIFINTWDFPFVFGLYCMASMIAFVWHRGWTREAFTVFFETALPLGTVCVLMYSLFLTGLSSQAGGIAPSGLFTTRTVQFVIMFILFLIPVLWWLLQKSHVCQRKSKRFGLKVGSWCMLSLFIVELIIFGVLCLMSRHSTAGTIYSIAGNAFTSMQGISDTTDWLAAFSSNRLFTLGTSLILFFIIGCVSALLSDSIRSKNDHSNSSTPIDVFCALLMLVAAALVLFPEFFYLRDFFGTRMNTIFKFYYQAWILFALAAAYCCADIFHRLRGWASYVFLFVMASIIIMCSAYPFWCTTEKISYLSRKALQDITLDGSAFLQRSRNDDWQGIEWLNTAPYGIVLEKVGESYSADNSVSTFTGLPAVQGPANHESQWRGGYVEMGTRQEDVKKIYESRNWTTTLELLERYHVRYIFIGSTERNAYNVQEQKFEKNLPLVFTENRCKIYQVY